MLRDQASVTEDVGVDRLHPGRLQGAQGGDVGVRQRHVEDVEIPLVTLWALQPRDGE